MQPRMIDWQGNHGTCSCGKEFTDFDKAQEHRCETGLPDPLLKAYRSVRDHVTNRRALKPLD